MASQPAPSDVMESIVMGQATVTDADTLEIRGVDVRLHGIDAPESNQTCVADGKRWPCGRRSANALDRRIEGRTVRCRGRTRDRYGRLIAVCYVSDTDINAWLVRNGWALAYRQYRGITSTRSRQQSAPAPGCGRVASCRRGSGAEDGGWMLTYGTVERPEPGTGTVPTSTRNARLSAFSSSSVQATRIA